ncbi:MAG: signal peptide peptidase Serine peptidase, family [Geobacteraceae bacterium]|jgi:protease-4|nr:signal peptide peptidase Serine peptidase, family [Geobacteraceae bacterium]
MRKRPVLLGVGISAALIILFLFSMILAGKLLGSKKSIISGEGVGIVEVKGLIVDSREIIEQLHDFRDNQKVKAIVLRIDSPGGVVGPTQEIYEEVRKIAAGKKVVASMGSVAASGGYYIAAPASMIFANPGTVTGSIGVLMKVSNIEGLLGKIGLKSYVLKSGRFKDSGSPVRTMTSEDRDVLQGVIESMHRQFVKAVAEGRKMQVSEVAGIADGRIFSGEQAMGAKLVDRLGNLQAAIAEAGKMAGIKGEPEVIYPPEKRKLWLDLLMEETVERVAGQAKGESGLKINYEMEGF